MELFIALLVAVVCMKLSAVVAEITTKTIAYVISCKPTHRAKTLNRINNKIS